MITRPLLSATAPPDLAGLKFPLLLSPKIDGIRCLKLNNHIVSRTLKNIPNHYIRKTLLSYNLPDGLDGELVTYSKETGLINEFNKVSSDIMSQDGEPHFCYHVFDLISADLSIPFAVRYYSLLQWWSQLPVTEYSTVTSHVKVVFHSECKSREDVEREEIFWLAKGQEGVMLRSPEGRYKCGRSTLREGILLKLKRFTDSEATIIGMTELMHNDNDETTNALGLTERSSHKENQRRGNTMGSLIVQDLSHPEWTSKQRKAEGLVGFEIGSGFTEKQRQYFWHNRELLVSGTMNNVLKYKFQSHGSIDAPRIPVFLGMRFKGDISQ